MDQIIELIAFYWADWQQTAIANTRYSAVLAAFSFLIGGLVVAILKRGKTVRLMRQIMQREQQLEKAEKTRQELLTKQKKDEAQLADSEQRLEQVSANLLKEKNEYQENLSKKDELFVKAANEKRQEVDAINIMLDEKTLLAERLQVDLNGQESKIAQYAESQAKITEMEKQLNQAVTDLNSVKQRLETEVSNKNEQIELSAKNNTDRVLELESQLKEITVAAEAEKIQQQTIIQQNTNSQILQEKLKSEMKSEMKTESIAKVENTVRRQEPQPAPVISAEKIQVQVKHSEPPVQTVQKTVSAKESSSEKQGVVGQVVGWFSSIDKKLESDDAIANNLEKSLQNEENKILQEKQKQEEKPDPEVKMEKAVQVQAYKPAVPSEKSQTQIKQAEPLQKKAALAKEDPNVEKQGVVGQVLGWFSSMDKALDTDDVTENKIESAVPEAKVEPEKKRKVERKPAIKETSQPVATISDDEGSSFSEKLAEVADTMDSFQSGLKKFFRKK